MDVLTDTMSTTQMQSKTGRVDSYDAMVEAERKKMYSNLDAIRRDAIRRDASNDVFAGYKTGKASQAAVKAEDTIRRDAFDDAYDAKYKAEKALQAAVEAEDDEDDASTAEDDEDDAIDKLFRKKINSMRARRDALIKFKKDHLHGSTRRI